MTHSKVLELAKQGDVKAIAFLINHQLQVKGITAKTAIKNQSLQVILESSEVPNQEDLVKFIRKEITALKVVSIERVKLYGRQIGDEFPAWTNEFEVLSQSDSVKPLEHTKEQKNEYYEIEGSNGQIRLTRTRVIISRKGTTAFITQGLKGDKEIPITRITAMQFKRSGSLTKGYLQFSIEGGLESTGGVFAAVTDENTVMFTELQEPKFEEVKRYIDSIIDGEPIDFNRLRFAEFEEIYLAKSKEQKQFREELTTSNKASNKILVKKSFIALLVVAILSFIIMSFSPDGSGLKILAGLTFITSSTCFFLSLFHLNPKEIYAEINTVSSYWNSKIKK